MIYDTVEAVSVANGGADILLFNGPIDRTGYLEITKLCARPHPATRAVVVLRTLGGNPHAAYRIARCLGSRYTDGFKLLIPGLCKSAGTLICVAANEIVIADPGELGPLDIQQRKPEEIGEMGSGLDLLVTLKYLADSASDAFTSALLRIRENTQVSTKVAADIASGITANLYSRIFEQIDPVRVGATTRSMNIAREYAQRLNAKSKTLKADALDRLIGKYPAHSFVIDRKEAKELFSNVTAPTPDEAALAAFFMGDDGIENRSVVSVLDVMKELKAVATAAAAAKAASTASAPAAPPATSSTPPATPHGATEHEHPADQRQPPTNGGGPGEPDRANAATSTERPASNGQGAGVAAAGGARRSRRKAADVRPGT